MLFDVLDKQTRTKAETGLVHVYCDGGVIGKNPSSVGGAIAYVHIVDDAILTQYAELVRVGLWDMRQITNNFTELLAAVRGVLSLPKNYRAIVHTDSRVTMLRLRPEGAAMAGIPDQLHELTRDARRRIADIVMVAGHPTINELRVGYRLAHGKKTLVSKWNVLCDRECCRVMNGD